MDARKVILPIITIILIITLVIIGFIFFKKNGNEKTATVPNNEMGELTNQPADEERTADSDGDGLTDEEEAQYGTNPNNADTDDDTYTDREELDNGYDPLVNEAAQKEITTETATGESNVTAVKNCGTNLLCLAAEAEMCNPATMHYTQSLDFFGLITTAAMDIAISPRDGDGCTFYEKVTSGQVAFSPEAHEKALATGASEEEIAAEEEKATANQQIFVGKEMWCPFQSGAELSAMLQRWNNGTYSSNDIDMKNCTGSLAEPSGGLPVEINYQDNTRQSQ